jgi:hypothetical protein
LSKNEFHPHTSYPVDIVRLHIVTGTGRVDVALFRFLSKARKQDLKDVLWSVRTA